MQDTHQIKETIKGILDSQKLSVLATQGDGKPYGSLVAFAATPDLKAVVFCTTRATREYANLLTDAHIAIVIDTRTNEQPTLRMRPQSRCSEMLRRSPITNGRYFSGFISKSTLI